MLAIGNAGFNAHDSPLPSARMVLDEMSQQNAPSRWLEEASSQPKPAQQLGTLGGGNHFLEVYFASTPVPILCTICSCTHALTSVATLFARSRILMSCQFIAAAATINIMGWPTGSMHPRNTSYGTQNSVNHLSPPFICCSHKSQST